MIDHTLPGAGSYMISFYPDLILSENVNGLCDEAVMKRNDETMTSYISKCT